MIPDDVEKIIMTKEDYDRNVEQLLLEKIELQERLEKTIEYLTKNCIKADKWIELENYRFIAAGHITYKPLSTKKVIELFDILRGVENEISNK